MYEQVSLPPMDKRDNIVCDKCGKNAVEIKEFYYDEDIDKMLCKICVSEEK